jgi:ornithine cyclodeaminase/alanine dehydrogenase-like protein (mu-crystallin family)
MILQFTASDIAAALPIGDCIDAMEAAFVAHAERLTIAPAVLGVHVPGGGFHVKTAGLNGDKSYWVAKVNANFPANPATRGLPTVQGALILFDAECGVPLAIMDSGEITKLRTAAASAVAARHLARADASVATICGCGLQGRVHVEALLAVRPLREIFLYDKDRGASERLAATLSHPGTRFTPIATLRDGTLASDIVATCTPAKAPILGWADLRPGAFVAAVGADWDTKQELETDLMKRGVVIADILEQCAEIGDLHHAIAAGVMTTADVRGELADVVTGRVGRASEDEIIVFDSTGTAIEDVAAAVKVLRAGV